MTERLIVSPAAGPFQPARGSSRAAAPTLGPNGRGPARDRRRRSHRLAGETEIRSPFAGTLRASSSWPASGSSADSRSRGCASRSPSDQHACLRHQRRQEILEGRDLMGAAITGWGTALPDRSSRTPTSRSASTPPTHGSSSARASASGAWGGRPPSLAVEAGATALAACRARRKRHRPA